MSSRLKATNLLEIPPFFVIFVINSFFEVVELPRLGYIVMVYMRYIHEAMDILSKF